MKKKFIVVSYICITATMLLGLLISYLLINFSDVVSSNYLTYHHAKNDNLFERGWLPDILPPSTFMISVNNNLDLNTSHGNFYLSKPDMNVFIDNLLITEDKDKYKYTDEYNSVWYFHINDNGKVTYELN
ncbi:hypothetical protein [Photobacterium angustum]|nr:hypothetical protein [Photobacterium angustum]